MKDTTIDEVARSRTLMVIISNMINVYQDSHRDNLNEDIFILFEKAKAVSFSNDKKSLDDAIKRV